MKKRIVFLILLPVCVILFGILFYLLSQPPKEKLSKAFKEQAVTKLLGRKAQLEDKNVPQGNATYDGKYISFEYPAKAAIYTYKDPYGASGSSSSDVLETFSFDMQSPKVVFSMMILKDLSRTPSINEISGVKFRETSGSYKGEDVVVSGKKGRVYEKNDPSGSEKTVFFFFDGKIYSLALTGDFDEIKKTYEIITKSLKFTFQN
jgi:hypothetical protein